MQIMLKRIFGPLPGKARRQRLGANAPGDMGATRVSLAFMVAPEARRITRYGYAVTRSRV